MWNPVMRGIVAGLAATSVLLLLALTKAWIPQLDLGVVLERIADAALGRIGLPAVPFAGVVLHYAIGTLWWGALFGILVPILPGERLWLKGVYYGAVAGLLVMLMVMPLAGAGYFGMQMSLPAPMVTLVLHMTYGAVLGIAYEWLGQRFSPAQASESR
jgi:uncharacterized membrane protein YagU involved in acid resistance